MTRTKNAKTFVDRIYCDTCGTHINGEPKQELTRADVVLTSHPMQYQYNCPVCGHAETNTVCYPLTYVREVPSV